MFCVGSNSITRGKLSQWKSWTSTKIDDKKLKSKLVSLRNFPSRCFRFRLHCHKREEKKLLGMFHRKGRKLMSCHFSRGDSIDCSMKNDKKNLPQKKRKEKIKFTSLKICGITEKKCKIKSFRKLILRLRFSFSFSVSRRLASWKSFEMFWFYISFQPLDECWMF